MNNIYDIVIIGAGPSGLTAALYAARANKKILILESEMYGGQILNAHKVENYPGIKSISGLEFSKNLYNQVVSFPNVEYKNETVKSIKEDTTKTVITNKDEYITKTIIIATGSKRRKLSVNNEDKFTGCGVSYCATCDGAFFKGRKVAVIGGGNTALDDSLYLSDIAETVYLIHHSDNFKGSLTTLNQLKQKDNVEILTNTEAINLSGDELLESITLKDNNHEYELPVSGLFIAIGGVPSLSEFANLINLNKMGYVDSSEDTLTNIPGIFASGDCRNKKIRQLTTAVSDGTNAAMEAIAYIAKLTK